jgi:hypothetical protein
MLKYLALLLIVSCGAPKEQPRIKDYPALRAQVERVEPLLLWCDGGVAFPRKNNITKQPMCDVGDSLSTTGAVLLLGGIGDFSVIDRSINADGRPWRHPSYVGKDKSNSFSRDQALGVMEATVATKNKAPLKRLLEYISRTDKLCPDATDGRCQFTDSVNVLAKDVMGEKVSKAERAKDELTILAEAHVTKPDYTSYLVARKLFLHYRTKTNTFGYRKAVDVLKSRFPDSLHIRTLYAVYHGKSLDGVAEALTACLEKWQKPGLDWFGDAVSVECTGKAHGADLVSLGKFLLTYRPE